MGDLFVSGTRLAEHLYWQEVEPLLRRSFPKVPHSAALIGGGSEVLGFDTDRSTDHNWGPRLQLFFYPNDFREFGHTLTELLANRLPEWILGHPTNLEPIDDDGTRRMHATSRPQQHGITVAELDGWLHDQLGFNPLAGITTFDWLATPTQTLAEVTNGAVFHDGMALLEQARRRLSWYPDDLWRYILACQWQRISQEEAFVARCGEVGDELGSTVVAARLVRDVLRLCLLMARRYPPYSKWLGSAFALLPCASELKPVLSSALTAAHWRERENYLATAYESVAALHNSLGLTAKIDTRTRSYHDRPFRVLHAERFAAALIDSITDSEVVALPFVGAIDQYIDSTDVLCDRARARHFALAIGPEPRIR